MNNLFDTSYTDPFSLTNPPAHLVNISSGAIASPEIEKSMTSIVEKGKELVDKFVDERLVPQNGTTKKSFYAVLPKSKLKTMSDMVIKIKTSKKSITADNETVYLRLMAINAKKKVPLLRVMSFENTNVPLSMFLEDGSMHLPKEAKAQYGHKLEGLLPQKTTTMAGADCVIYDMNCVVRFLPFEGSNFEELASSYKTTIFQTNQKIGGGGVKQTHLIFDRYYKVSPKSQTRQDRGGVEGITDYHITQETKLPDKEAFLNSGKNKEGLARVFTEYMEIHKDDIPQTQAVFVSGGQGDVTKKIKCDSIDDVNLLKSNQEEADTRIVFHCKYAALHGAKLIVVRTQDNDVLILLIHHFPSIRARKVFVMTGVNGVHTNNTRYVPVHDIYKKLTTPQRNLLLPIYCLSGCDTTSCFHGHAKITAYNILKNHSSELQELAPLGKEVPPTRSQLVAGMKFVCMMYGKRACSSLNQLRCERASKAGKQLKKLPPTENSFEQHLLRCCLQMMVWVNAGIGMHEEADYSKYGWYSTEYGLKPIMMTQPCAAPELLKDVVCECPSSECSNACSCLDNNQPCTDDCNCKGRIDSLYAPEEEDEGNTTDQVCTNPKTMESAFPLDDDSDEDD